MKSIRNTNRLGYQLMTALTAAFAIVLIFGTNHAKAQNSFSIQLGESPRLLEAELENSRGNLSDLELAEIALEESCVNPVARYQNRNRFSILVNNTSDTNSLTSVSIDIEELGFEFGDGDFPADGFNGLFAMDMGRSDPGVSFTAGLGDDPSELVINFDGLVAGFAAILRVDLDPSADNTSGLEYPDFREAILGANGNERALFDVGFSAGNNFTGLQFPANMITEPINSAVLEPYHAQTMATPFELTGDNVIPEPSTALLISSGIALLASRRRIV